MVNFLGRYLCKILPNNAACSKSRFLSENSLLHICKVLSNGFTSAALSWTISVPDGDFVLLQWSSCIRHRAGQKWFLQWFDSFPRRFLCFLCVLRTYRGGLHRISSFFLQWAGRMLDASSPSPQVWDITHVPWQSENNSSTVTPKQPWKPQFILNWILNMSKQLPRKRSILYWVYTNEIPHLEFLWVAVSVEKYILTEVLLLSVSNGCSNVSYGFCDVTEHKTDSKYWFNACSSHVVRMTWHNGSEKLYFCQFDKLTWPLPDLREEKCPSITSRLFLSAIG